MSAPRALPGGAVLRRRISPVDIVVLIAVLAAIYGVLSGAAVSPVR